MSLLFNMLSRLVMTFLVNSAMNIGYKYLFEALLSFFFLFFFSKALLYF